MAAIRSGMRPTALAIALGAALAIVEAHVGTGHQDDLLVDWRYAVGDPMEGLHAGTERLPAASELVSLPHRVHEPNHPLWYARTTTLPAASALFVDADDGAQVFADGVRLANYRRWFFVPDSPAPTRRIVVRVLNNAMRGGLRSVSIVAASSVVRESVDAGSLPEGFAPVGTDAFRAHMPAPGEPCHFTAWADSQGGWTTFHRLVALMLRRRPDFSVGIGDLVNDGSDAQAWRAFLSVLAPLAAQIPIVPVAGNHDYDGYYNDLRPRHYLDLFRPDGASWFAWSCGPVRFAAIDMNAEFPIGLSAQSPQYGWLMNEVRSVSWTGARWRVLLVHQPPWSRSWAGYEGDEVVRDIVTSLAASHGLDLVMAGHSHAYERLTRTVNGRAVHVVITGGAGGTLEGPLSTNPEHMGTIILKHHFVDVGATRDSMAFEAVDADGHSIDRWRLAR
jgi:predicted phosphodiesterase